MLAKRCGSNPPRDVQVHYSLSAELPIAARLRAKRDDEKDRQKQSGGR